MILDIRGINTYYGLGHILHGLSLSVAEGEVVALLGRNGAGKTTTLRSITGLTPPRTGEIRYKGRDIVGIGAHRISRMGIALVPETRGVFSYLTARENLSIARRPGSRWQVEAVLERFPKLREVLDRKGRLLSGGEQQMLAIARAMMLEPKIILLDEPTEGLMPRMVAQIREIIALLHRERVAILLVEQNVPLTLEVSDRIYIMEKGVVRHHAAAATLRSDDSIIHQYLGV